MMKKFYSLFFVALLVVTATYGQNTCSTPYPIRSATPSAFGVVTGLTNTDFSNDYGCITPADNAKWLYFQACTPGNITLSLWAAGGSDSDVNFIIWGPLSSLSDCGLTSGQIIDCSASTSTVDTISITGANAGDYYKILISNVGTTTGSFSLFNESPPGIIFDSVCTYCVGTGPIPPQQICQVTTEPLLNQNIIIWEKDTLYSGPYIVQKESTTMGIYNTIATVMNNDTSAYIDSISNPMIQAFKYRIGIPDTCGFGTVGYENPHKTIHLLTSISSSTGYPQLSWSSYSGFSFGTYYIFRGSSPATLILYDSISASFNSYTDVAAVPGINFYSVSVLPAAPCQPSRAMNMYSYSNVSPVAFTGINEYEFNQLSVGPNPANDILNFSLGNVSADVNIDIIDLTGRVLISKEFENINLDVVLLNDLSNGSYIVRFASENTTSYRNIIIAK